MTDKVDAEAFGLESAMIIEVLTESGPKFVLSVGTVLASSGPVFCDAIERKVGKFTKARGTRLKPGVYVLDATTVDGVQS